MRPPNHIRTIGLQSPGIIVSYHGALAEFERTLIAERSQAGMQAARRRGKHIGHPRKLTREQVAYAARMVCDGTATVSGMAALYGVDRVTLHRALKRAAAPDVMRGSSASLQPRQLR